MVSAKTIQRLLSWGVGVIALYFTARFGVALCHYFPLRGQAKAQLNRWEVEEAGDRFVLKGDYSFEVQKNIWHNSSILGKSYYSEAAAVAALKKMAMNSWTVWYSPRNPKMSALEKEFPYSFLARTLICYGVCIYFIFLNRKIRSVDLLS